MSFWSDADWVKVGADGKPQGESVVEPFDPNLAKHADYTLAIGDEVYLSEGDKKAILKLSAEEDFVISPGQFCFIITSEVIHLSQKYLGFISIRASTKFYGLVNVSGFHVDPGYSGRLIFSAFNAGPTAIHLKQGERIFSLWVSELATPAVAVPKVGYNSIPSALVNKISGEFLTAYQLREKISAAEEKIKSLEDTRRKVAVYGVIILLVLGVFFQDALIGMASNVRDWAVTQTAHSSTQVSPVTPTTQTTP